TAAATVARCRELGWGGDVAFAHDRACALRTRGAGCLRIEAELVSRGVSETVVAQAIEAAREGEPERGWARRAARGTRDRARGWRLLVSRGFPQDVVEDLVGRPEDA